MFSGDTSSFLLLLALGTSFPMIIGFFLVRPIPLPSYETMSRVEYGAISPTRVAAIDAPGIIQHENSSETPLLTNMEEPSLSPRVPLSSTSLELSPTRNSFSGTSHRRSRNNLHRPTFGGAARMLETLPNIHGKELWMSGDFWMVFAILSLRM